MNIIAAYLIAGAIGSFFCKSYTSAFLLFVGYALVRDPKPSKTAVSSPEIGRQLSTTQKSLIALCCQLCLYLVGIAGLIVVGGYILPG